MLILAWAILTEGLNEKHNLEENVIRHPTESTDFLHVPMAEQNQCGVQRAHELYSLEIAVQQIRLFLSMSKNRFPEGFS